MSSLEMKTNSPQRGSLRPWLGILGCGLMAATVPIKADTTIVYSGKFGHHQRKRSGWLAHQRCREDQGSGSRQHLWDLGRGELATQFVPGELPLDIPQFGWAILQP